VSSQTLPLPNSDREMLDDLYRRFHPRVMRLCLHLLGSVEEAEDAASEIFTRLPASLATYDRTKPIQRWLSRVTSNYCVDLLRRRRSEQRVFSPTVAEAPEAVAPASSPFEEYLRKEEKNVVCEAVAGLPEHYRRPLIQRYWGELGYAEIAKNLGLTRPNVATLIFRAKQGLRHALALEGNTGRPAEWAWDSTR
jgi:RNA polymerase sigma-70 factor, ECF subfamily